MPVIKTGRSQFIEKLHDLLEHSPDSESLRWISTEAFEITCDDASACQVLKPAWDFKSLNSFIRQLSYYNFTRLSDRRRSTERHTSASGYIVFSHPSGFFVPGDGSRLSGILRRARKRVATKSPLPTPAQPSTGGVIETFHWPHQDRRRPKYEARPPSDFGSRPYSESPFPSVRPTMSLEAPWRGFERPQDWGNFPHRPQQHPHLRAIENAPAYTSPPPVIRVEDADFVQDRRGLGVDSDPYGLSKVNEYRSPYPSPDTTPTFESFPESVHSPQVAYRSSPSASHNASSRGAYHPPSSASSYAPPPLMYRSYTPVPGSSQDDTLHFAPFDPRGHDDAARCLPMGGDRRPYSSGSYFPKHGWSSGDRDGWFEEGGRSERYSPYGRRGTA